MTIDPAIHLSLRMALSLLFLTAAIHKLRDHKGFRAALENYRLLPQGAVGMAAAILVVTELSVALSLPLYGGTGPAFVAAFLLALYAAAIGVNLARGRRDIDCGCAGPARAQPLSAVLVVRNVVLCAIALAASFEPLPRGLLWIDVVTIAATIAFFCLLYASIEELIANHPRVAGLGGADAAQARKPASPQARAVELGGVVQ